jgi:uncharacterized protein (UPF0333 family)
MKKLFSLVLSAGILAASMALISVPATASAAPQATGQSHNAAVKAKHKSRALKAKHAKKSKKSKKHNKHAAPKK